MVSIITQLLPVLSLLVATPFAIPMEYDSSPMAPPMAAGAGHDSAPAMAPAPSAPGGSYGSPAPALSGVEPVHAGASAAPTIAYNEGTQHSLLWASWSQSATGAGAAPTHGSGSMPATDMNSCMQMCQATYGGPSHAVDATRPAATSAPSGPPAVITPPGTPTDSGPAVTHTIIVAPTKGVLRFVPFSVNANVGDSLEFIWGAGPHSATLSQGQNVCNKSSAVDSFDSGKLNATATYTVKVNATTPNFHYCTVGMHCTAGMYGVVNPPTTNVTTNVTATRTTAAGPGSTAGSGSSGCNGNRMDCWVANWAASSPEASATVKAVSKACEGGDAWKWGAGLDMSAMLGDAVTKQNAIENVMYTRLMLSMNPSMLTNSAVPANFVSPPELKAFVTSSESGNSTAPAPAAGGDGYGGAPPSASADAASAGMNTPTSGASRLASPVLLLAAISAGIAILI